MQETITFPFGLLLRQVISAHENILTRIICDIISEVKVSEEKSNTFHLQWTQKQMAQWGADQFKLTIWTKR